MKHCKKSSLSPTRQNRILKDFLKSHNTIEVTEFDHMRINHSKFFVDRGNHINEIERFSKQEIRNLRVFEAKNFRKNSFNAPGYVEKKKF